MRTAVKSVRFSVKELELLEEAALLTGDASATIIRNAAVKEARRVIKKYQNPRSRGNVQEVQEVFVCSNNKISERDNHVPVI